MDSPFAALTARLTGPLYLPGDDGYAPEIAAFNTATVHTPEAVVGAENANDVLETVRFARDNDYKVSVQATGHGAEWPINSGILITTGRMKNVSIEPDTRIATIGAGARWGAVIAEGFKYGLAPITGSSPNVGVVGYILGGGVGPLSRSHGFSSDYLASLAVVTGTGELLEANANSNADLFWAMRGGKEGFGIVTEVQVRLVKIDALYAGSLWYEEDNIEAALRTWIDWTASADPDVTTSVAIFRFPDLPFLPPMLRGRRLLSLRFAYPGDVRRGAELAAPFRAAAPLYMDELGELPLDKTFRIHNDPTQPAPSWVRGMMLSHVDQQLATTLLSAVGKGTDHPFVAVEIRQMGEATRDDVPEGSSVGGREANFTLGMISSNPQAFAEAAPAFADKLTDSLSDYIAPITNINFKGIPTTAGRPLRNWTPDVEARLQEIREKYNPTQTIA